MIAELEEATLSEYQPLAEPELLKHIRQAQRGGTAAQEAMATLLRRNIRLIRREAFRFLYRESAAYTRDDIEQAALLAFWKAVQGFQPQRRVRFSTYVTCTLRREIRRACDNSTGGIRVSVSSQRQLRMLRRGEGQLMAALGRAPTSAEIGEATGFSAWQLNRLGMLPRVAFSMDDKDETLERRLPAADLELDGEPHQRAAVVEFLRETLPEPLYDIVFQHFGFDPSARSGLTSAELAARLHLDESQITKMLGEARRILRLPENASRLRQLLDSG